jgi:feruloyl esterase
MAGASMAAHADSWWDWLRLPCDSLTAVTSDSATVRSASLVTSPATIAGAAVDVPFCRVQGVARPSADSEINFEVWLPASAAWTGRLKVNGTGGYAGGTPYARLAQDIGDGFVTAGSDMGHVGGESAAWTLNHPEKVKDWGLRAHYFVTTAAKTVANAYYAKSVDHSYFEGCSNGGRQAMMMAQRFPDLFDGIAAGAPSMFYPDLLMSLLWTGKLLTPVLGQPASISPAKRAMITQRVLAECDALDGLVDGTLTSPRACTFRPETLRCTAGDAPDCLTDQELNVVMEVYRGIHTETGVQRWNGLVLSSEISWDPNFADNGGYGRFIGHYVYSMESPPFDWRNLNFSSDYDFIKQTLTPITAAPSPDLTAFKAHGGKLIQYHGWIDPIVGPDGSPNYFKALTQFEKLKDLPQGEFDQQIEALTPSEVNSTALAFGPTVQEYHRLFMMPGVPHCGIEATATGPNAVGGGFTEPPKALRNAEHHVVSAVIKWVEEGVAPETIIASRIVNAAVVLERPLCVYPKVAVYKGSGDINVASSFACAMPEQLITTATDIVQIQNSLRQRDVLAPTR